MKIRGILSVVNHGPIYDGWEFDGTEQECQEAAYKRKESVSNGSYAEWMDEDVHFEMTKDDGTLHYFML